MARGGVREVSSESTPEMSLILMGQPPPLTSSSASNVIYRVEDCTELILQIVSFKNTS